MTEYTLGEITTGIFDGKHGGCKEVPNTGYYFVSVKDLTEFGIDYSGVKQISESDFNEIYYRTSLENGDVVYANTGDTIGKCAFIIDNDRTERTAFQKSVAVLKPNKDIILDRYLYYLMKYYTPALREAATGSAQKNLLLSTMRNFKVEVPTLEVQSGIVSVLADIDDKIRANQRINDNLLQQVIAVFYNMFGDQTDKSATLLDKRFGKIIKAKVDQFDGEKIYIATADISEQIITDRSTKVTYNDRPSRANMQPCYWSLWFAKMKNSRKLFFINDTDFGITKEYIFSTGFYGLQAVKDYFYYLWAFLSTDEFDDLKNMYSNGTTMQALNNDGLAKILLYIPTVQEALSFNEFAEPAFNQIQFNNYDNLRLAELRDALLPRLMTGMIDVSSL